MSGIDRIVIQDYVIDTIHYFDGDNNELARRLGIGRRVCPVLLTLYVVQIGSCLAPRVRMSVTFMATALAHLAHLVMHIVGTASSTQHHPMLHAAWET